MQKNNYTRRDFVLKSAAGIGGLAVAGYATQAATLEEKIGDASTNKYETSQPVGSVVIEENDVVIENDQMRLVIGANAVPKSLMNKSNQEECLARNVNISISAITQKRPYNNEIKLAYPCEERTFSANAIKREGDLLVIKYELIHYKALIRINIKPGYIEFKLEGFALNGEDDFGLGVMMKHPAVWKISFLQLPVKERTYYGDWLQVVWDKQVATNFLATGPFARIEAFKNKDYFLMRASAEREMKLKGVSVALITCSTNKLLDNIERVEEDFELAPGVKSRRRKEYRYSYYWTGDINSTNIDRHLKYAKLGGFRAMSIYYFAFLEGKGYQYTGDYKWDRKLFPNGKSDLKQLLDKIKKEGITPGIHTLHSFIGLNSKYVSPVPDHRLNLVQRFTLSAPLGKEDTTVFVDEDPGTIEMTDGRRVLKVGTELISYTGYTDDKPYRITGCIRGALQTKPDSHPAGLIIGVLDISEFGARSVYINQDNDLQDEMAEKIADFYDAGFQFCYYDGSEGVNAPFWCNIARAQWRVHKRLNPQPLFAEGAAKTHFSWHMLSRGNAFDVFKPEVLKEEIKKHPVTEAPRMKANFSHLNFGWLGYFLPDENTIGTQPDMLEYVASRAAAWDCHISMQSNLKKFDDHLRTPDNFEVMRRWEEIRVNDWLTEEQKLSLQNLEQEHILLINEKNEFELQSYDQITNVAGNSREIRAFIFERGGNLYVVYWHISGAKKLVLSLDSKKITVMDSLEKKSSVAFSKQSGRVVIPVSNRRYIKFSRITRDQVITAFQNAIIMP